MTSNNTIPSAAEIVSKARNLMGENQTEFGARFGKSQSLMSKYERGDVEPPSDMIIQSMTILDGENNLERLTPQRLARDIERLADSPVTLPVRRAIRDMLELSKRWE